MDDAKEAAPQSPADTSPTRDELRAATAIKKSFAYAKPACRHGRSRRSFR